MMTIAFGTTVGLARTALLALLLSISSCTRDASGIVEWTCAPIRAGNGIQLTLQLTRLPHQAPAGTLFIWFSAKTGQLSVNNATAQWCPPKQPCNIAPQYGGATLVFRQGPQEGEIFRGTFEVNFPGGKQMKGSFQARPQLKQQPTACE